MAVWMICAALAAVLLGSGFESSRAWLAGILQAGWGIAVLVGMLVLLPFAIYGLTRLLARLFPIAPGYELTYTQPDWENFRRHTWLSVILYVVIAAALGLLFYGIFSFSTQAAARLSGSLYALPGDPGGWIFPSACGSIALSGLIVYWIYQHQMKDSFPRFVAFQNQRLGFDQRRAGLALFFGGLLLTLGLILGGLGNTLRAGQEAITISGPFGLAHSRFRYDQVVVIEERTQIDPHQAQRTLSRTYVLKFKDGWQWQSVPVGFLPVPPVYQAALAYIAQRSGISFEKTITEP